MLMNRQPLPHLFDFQIVDVDAVDGDVPTARLDEAEERETQRRLAGSRLSNDSDLFAALDLGKHSAERERKVRGASETSIRYINKVLIYLNGYDAETLSPEMKNVEYEERGRRRVGRRRAIAGSKM
jgi:hypothetical protein